MEIQLVFGPNGSGKSLYAETLAAQTAAPLVYIATMIPQTEDNFSRIEKHRRQREGKGFLTMEEPWDIDLLSISKEAVVLLEDASNLLANGIFQHRQTASVCFQKIQTLAKNCQKLIIVSITGLTPGEYDDETNNYILQLDKLNQMLRSVASDCIQF